MTGRPITSCGAVLAILFCVLPLGIKGLGPLPATAGEPGKGQGTKTGPVKAAGEERDLEEEKERKERIKQLTSELMKLEEFIDTARAKLRHPYSDPAIVAAEHAADKLEAEMLRESGAKDVPARQDRPRPHDSAARPRKKDTRLPQPKQARLTTHVNPKELKPGQTFTYNVKVRLDDGWRIFPFLPEQPPGRGPCFTKFDFFDTGGFEVVSNWHASMPATAKHLPAFPDLPTVDFFEEEVTWAIRLKVPRAMEAGEKTLNCQAAYQLMNDKSVTFPGRWTLPEVRVNVSK